MFASFISICMPDNFRSSPTTTHSCTSSMSPKQPRLWPLAASRGWLSPWVGIIISFTTRRVRTMLTQMPLPSSQPVGPIPAELVHLMVYLDSSPLSSTQIQRWTDTDPILSAVKRWVQEGWPDNNEKSEDILSQKVRTKYRGGMCVVGE